MSLLPILLSIVKKRAKEYALLSIMLTFLFSLSFASFAFISHGFTSKQKQLSSLFEGDLWIFDRETKSFTDPKHLSLKKALPLYKIGEFSAITPISLSQASLHFKEGTGLKALLVGIGDYQFVHQKVSRLEREDPLYLDQAFLQKHDQEALPLEINRQIAGNIRGVENFVRFQNMPLVLTSLERAFLLTGNQSARPSALIARVKHPEDVQRICRLVEKFTGFRAIEATQVLKYFSSESGLSSFFHQILVSIVPIALLAAFISLTCLALHIFSKQILARFSILARLGANPRQLLGPVFVHYTLLIVPPALLSLLIIAPLSRSFEKFGIERISHMSLLAALSFFTFMLLIHLMYSWTRLAKEGQ